jgi:hypothetical protein
MEEREREREIDREKLITKLYNKLKILTSYVLDPHNGKKV